MLVPALLFVLVGTVVAGQLLLTPVDYSELAKATVAALFSLANIFVYFFVDTGYFASDSGELPLLHLWSLGVEEQFYLLWPLLVLGILKVFKSRRERVVCVGGILLVFLGAAQLLVGEFHSFSYYMLPTRAWELMAGGILAFWGGENSGRVSKNLSEVLSFVGTGLIFGSFFLVSEAHDIPGFGAVPVILGTVFLIASRSSSAMNRVFAIKPLVAIGLVSYSAYLWHWPLLAFLRYSLVELTWFNSVLAFVLTFVMATISYFLIERPLRYYKGSTREIFLRYFIVPAALSLLVCGGIVVGVHQKHELFYPQEYQASVERTLPAFKYKYNCQFARFEPKALVDERCVFPEGVSPSAVLNGDSNAAHYLGMLRGFASHYDFGIRNVTQSACPMLFTPNELDWVRKKYRPGCFEYRTRMPDFVKDYELVFVGGSWNSYDQVAREEFRDGFKKALTRLSKRNRDIVLLGKVPVFPGYTKDCEQRRVKITGLECNSQFDVAMRQNTTNDYLRELAGEYENVTYWDITWNFVLEENVLPI